MRGGVGQRGMTCACHPRLADINQGRKVDAEAAAAMSADMVRTILNVLLALPANGR